METLESKLLKIQIGLTCPKLKKAGSGGNYSYRSTEDILENVKSLLDQYGVLLTFKETVRKVSIRERVDKTINVIEVDKILVEVVATVCNIENRSEKISCNGSAISDTRAFMNESQKVGSTISYAKKYALGSLFAIDDARDMDSQEVNKKGKNKKAVKLINKTELADLNKRMLAKKLPEYRITKWAGIEELSELTQRQYILLVNKWEAEDTTKNTGQAVAEVFTGSQKEAEPKQTEPQKYDNEGLW